MSTLDVVTLIFALWGSILSTYLAIREVNKDKRKLKLNLEEIAFYEAHRLVITNTGIRPITIEQISLAILDKNEKWFVDGVPRGSLWKDEEGIKPPTLPLTLEGGWWGVCAFFGRVLALGFFRFDRESTLRPTTTNIHR